MSELENTMSVIDFSKYSLKLKFEGNPIKKERISKSDKTTLESLRALGKKRFGIKGSARIYFETSDGKQTTLIERDEELPHYLSTEGKFLYVEYIPNSMSLSSCYPPVIIHKIISTLLSVPQNRKMIAQMISTMKGASIKWQSTAQ